MYMYLSLALTLAAGIGFVYGLFRFFRDESALYVRMIVFGVGCRCCNGYQTHIRPERSHHRYGDNEHEGRLQL